jgi:hypothetical protein
MLALARQGPAAAARPAAVPGHEAAPIARDMTPLNLAAFTVTSPNGHAQHLSGTASLSFGGIHTWQFLTVGYALGFTDASRTLAPGAFDTATTAGLFMENAPSCNQNANRGGFEIDQAQYNGSGVLTVGAVQFDFVCPDGTSVQGTIAYDIVNTTPHQGYYLYRSDGGLTGFGNDSYLRYLGDLTTVSLNKPVAGMAITSDGGGYWMVASDGGIFSFGDAAFFGSAGSLPLNKPIVGMAATPDGGGYWLVASDGGIFAYGDAPFFGSTGGMTLNRPIVGMASTPSGHGYWLVASDGGVFAYGDAPFAGSTGSIRLNKPIVGLATTSSGRGYWLVASDGGIFAYGDAGFFGSAGSLPLIRPVVGMDRTPDGQGYALVASDGGLFTYGDAVFAGSLGGLGITDVVGMAG